MVVVTIPDRNSRKRGHQVADARLLGGNFLFLSKVSFSEKVQW